MCRGAGIVGLDAICLRVSAKLFEDASFSCAQYALQLAEWVIDDCVPAKTNEIRTAATWCIINVEIAGLSITLLDQKHSGESPRGQKSPKSRMEEIGGR